MTSLKRCTPHQDTFIDLRTASIFAVEVGRFAALQTLFVHNGYVDAIILGNGDFIILHNVHMDQLPDADVTH